MNGYLRWFALAFGIAAFWGAPAAAEEPAKPIALHPENPHYFLWRGQPTVLITSGEHYGALLNLDFDYVRYFDELASHGLNHTRLFSGAYRETTTSFGITHNTLAPKPGRFIAPWARSDAPGGFLGENKFDLSKWDEAYFRRLKDLLEQARRRGIVVEMNLFCPMYNDDVWAASPMHAANNIQGVGDCPANEVYALRHDDLFAVQRAMVVKIATELREFDNLYYEVCNEPYFGGVTTQWQHAIVDTLVETERNFPARRLISLNIANGRAKVEQPHPAVSILNFHYCTPPDAVALNYGLNLLVGENETGFRGKDDILYRTEAWDFLLAGGGLFNNLDYSFTADHPQGSFRDYQSPGGGSEELRRQLGVLKKFLTGFDFLRMKPDAAVVRQVSPPLTASALVEHGKAYAVYLHVPLPEKPTRLQDHLKSGIEASLLLDLPTGDYAVQWIDPLTGEVAKQETIRHEKGDCELASPPFDNDIALRVTRTP